jgi:chromodomain-helicase-DNA-binding protein 7
LSFWRSEFEHWTELNVVVCYGSSESCNIVYEYEFPVVTEDGTKVAHRVAFDVLLTNYETFVTDWGKFQEIEWRYLVLDECHRVMNQPGKCYKLLQQLRFEHCPLLTGIPVRKDIEQFWRLLHFLHPQRFTDLPAFMAYFGAPASPEKTTQWRKLKRKFLLRRKKVDVDRALADNEGTVIQVELTRIQKTFYRGLFQETD